MTSPPPAIGRYEVERRLGQGGMGAVYLARDPAIGRHVAIKVLRTNDDEYRRRFRIEVQAVGALRHRHVITIFDSGEHDGAPFLAMEYIPGETLAEKIARRPQLALSQKLRYIEELCEGLAYAHRAGIIHRDIKPANVMVDSDSDSVKIVDFGIVRVADSGATRAGALVGTLTYMAPEQVRGQRADQRSDIFAVGLVSYELLAYKRAFSGAIHEGLLHKLLHEQPEPLSDLVPDLDPEVIEIVDRALRKEPDERYQDASEMAAALHTARLRALANEQRAAKGLGHSPAWWLARLGTVAVLAAGAVYSAWSVRGGFPEWSRTDTLGAAETVPSPPASVSPPSTGPPVSPPPPTRVEPLAAAKPVSAPAQPDTPSAPPAERVLEPRETVVAVPAETVLRIQAAVEIEATLNGSRTSLQAVVSPGEHELVVRRPGILGALRQQIRMASGETRTVAPEVAVGAVRAGELPFPFESVTVEGVAITGSARALATTLVAQFAPARGSAVPPQRRPFQLTAGAELELSTLIPAGGFRFEITPAAEVTVEHQAFGNVTEGSLSPIAAGQYAMRIARRGYPDFMTQVQIRAGRDSLVSLAYNFASGSWVVR